MSKHENRIAGQMAIDMAELALRCVGPEGAVVQVPEEDSPMLRSAFISRLAEAAMKFLEEEK